LCDLARQVQYGAKRNRMGNLSAVLMLAVCVVAAPLQPGKIRKAGKSSLTGCVDEREGEYVLTNNTNLQPTARLLPASGSPDDNFARHMGHTVKVRGVLSKQDPLPIITVEGVETVSQTCAPASEGQQQ